MNSTQPNSDSAILFLDNGDNNNLQSTASAHRPMDGHQILDQVQLQFIPTGNDDVFVGGQIPTGSGKLPPTTTTATASTITSLSSEPTVIVHGTLENKFNRDTDFLMDDTQPIDLGSPIHRSNDPNKPKLTIWQFDYYARYFDLTTEVFFQRILWSLLPLTKGGDKGTYIDRYISTVPDLYGPFWIPLTLAFTITICDDIIRYMNLNIPDIVADQSNKTIPSTKPIIDHHDHPLTFDMDGLNMALTITFSYVILAPIILWSFCQWRRCHKLYTFVECMCAYGYSLSLFIPITILSLINVKQIQFILFASAAFLSGSVLLISFAPVVHSDPSRSFKFAYVMLLFILLAHLTLALFYLNIFL